MLSFAVSGLSAGILSENRNGTAAAIVNDRWYPLSTVLFFSPPRCSDIDYSKSDLIISVTLSDGETQVKLTNFTLTTDCVGNVKRPSKAVDIFVFAISAVSSFICLVFLVMVAIWRERPTIRSISPAFCAITLAGALFSSISPIFLTTRLHNCMAWLCYLTLGIVFFFSAIAAKTCAL